MERNYTITNKTMQTRNIFCSLINTVMHRLRLSTLICLRRIKLRLLQTQLHNRQHTAFLSMYTVSQKKPRNRVFVTTNSPNTDRFSKFFQWHIFRQICNKIITKDTNTSEIASLHYHVKYKCQKISVRCTLRQSCWKINLPESWHTASSK